MQKDDSLGGNHLRSGGFLIGQCTGEKQTSGQLRGQEGLKLRLFTGILDVFEELLSSISHQNHFQNQAYLCMSRCSLAGPLALVFMGILVLNGNHHQDLGNYSGGGWDGGPGSGVTPGREGE